MDASSKTRRVQPNNVHYQSAPIFLLLIGSQETHDSAIVDGLPPLVITKQVPRQMCLHSPSKPRPGPLKKRRAAKDRPWAP
jgi:hypothetical protein